MSLLGFSLNSRFRRLPVLKAGLPYVTEAFSFLPKPIISPFLLLWVNNTIARPAAQLGGALSLTSCTQSPNHRPRPVRFTYKNPLLPLLRLHFLAQASVNSSPAIPSYPPNWIPSSKFPPPTHPSHCCQGHLPKNQIA